MSVPVVFPFATYFNSKKMKRNFTKSNLSFNLTTFGLMILLASRDFGGWVSQSFSFLMLLLFLMNIVAATQDIATDGLAVSRLAPHLRGLGNSVQVIGYKTGMIFGGGLLLWLVARYGWQLSYTALAFLIIPILLPVWLMHEPEVLERNESTRAPWHGWQGYVKLFADFLSRERMGWWLITVATFKAGDALASRMIGPLLSDQGMSLSDIGLLTGVVGATAGLAGALLGGLFLLRLGHFKALLIFGAMQAAGFIGYLFIAGGGLFTQMFGYQAVFAAGVVLTLCALVPVVMYFRTAGYSPSSGK